MLDSSIEGQMYTGHHAEQTFAAFLSFMTGDLVKWGDLFADDAVVDFPYAPSIGYPRRIEGKEAIYSYYTEALRNIEEFSFSNVRIYPTNDPDVALAEVHGHAMFSDTGFVYDQDYVMLLETRGGKIIRYREYWNPVPALHAS